MEEIIQFLEEAKAKLQASMAGNVALQNAYHRTVEALASLKREKEKNGKAT
jgi:hypothetical protein